MWITDHNDFIIQFITFFVLWNWRYCCKCNKQCSRYWIFCAFLLKMIKNKFRNTFRVSYFPTFHYYCKHFANAALAEFKLCLFFQIKWCYYNDTSKGWKISQDYVRASFFKTKFCPNPKSLFFPERELTF